MEGALRAPASEDDGRFKGDALVSDAVKKVREAEKGAEDVVRAARAEGKTLVAGAHEQIEGLFEAMRKSARDEAEALVAAARRDAEAEADRIAAGSKADVEAARAGADGRISDGVSRVVDAIKGSV